MVIMIISAQNKTKMSIKLYVHEHIMYMDILFQLEFCQRG